MKWTITVVTLVAILTVWLYYYTHSPKYSIEKVDYKTVYIGDGVSPAMKKLLKQSGIESSTTDSDLYLPGNFTYISKELKSVKMNKNQIMGAIANCDYFVAKDYIWKILCNEYKINGAQKLMPRTYILSENNDCKLIKQFQDPDKIYILKKNIQRQEGLKLILAKDLNQESIQKFIEEGYVLLQQFIDNPFLVSNRKLNIRVYVLFINKKGIRYVFMYGDGFMYYTSKNYKYSLDPEEMITTGYVNPRTFYDTNPLTHKDLCNFLGDKKYDMLFRNIRENLKHVTKAIFNQVNVLSERNMDFQLFGCDYQINQDLSVFLLEFNKGMSLQEMDERDGKVKYNLQKDTLKLIGVKLENSDNDFQHVYIK